MYCRSRTLGPARAIRSPRYHCGVVIVHARGSDPAGPVSTRSQSSSDGKRIRGRHVWVLATVRQRFRESYHFVRLFLRPPEFEGAVLTPKRLLNCYRARWAANRLSTRLTSYPVQLTIEPTTVCNLACPACFTGAGEVGRQRGAMSLDCYRRLLDELGDYLMQLVFFNWGEPLLAKNLVTMIAEARQRGISTLVSTNFSLPFSAQKADALVGSGLDVLGVSLDGARQETYEQYRVGGKLDLVLENCRLIRDTKARRGAKNPRVIWEFHVFPHNIADVEMAGRMAAELEMDFVVSKGWVIGPDWDPERRAIQPPPIVAFPCTYLWESAVVNNDGGVAPCCGTFYSEDDMGTLSFEPDRKSAASFFEVWNNQRFQQARAFFRNRGPASEAGDHVCHTCPVTLEWEGYQRFISQGGLPQNFKPKYGANERYNYFWDRKGGGRQQRELSTSLAVPSKSSRGPS